MSHNEVFLTSPKIHPKERCLGCQDWTQRAALQRSWCRARRRTMSRGAAPRRGREFIQYAARGGKSESNPSRNISWPVPLRPKPSLPADRPAAHVLKFVVIVALLILSTPIFTQYFCILIFRSCTPYNKYINYTTNCSIYRQN
jgi:hypothetical protein